jgi:hypothetical protein
MKRKCSWPFRKMTGHCFAGRPEFICETGSKTGRTLFRERPSKRAGDRLGDNKTQVLLAVSKKGGPLYFRPYWNPFKRSLGQAAAQIKNGFRKRVGGRFENIIINSSKRPRGRFANDLLPVLKRSRVRFANGLLLVLKQPPTRSPKQPRSRFGH